MRVCEVVAFNFKKRSEIIAMAPDKNNERRKNISPVQLEIMVSFMEKNLDFARGKLKREESERLWETLSKKLNAVPDGAIKEINKWKLVCRIFLLEIEDGY